VNGFARLCKHAARIVGGLVSELWIANVIRFGDIGGQLVEGLRDGNESGRQKSKYNVPRDKSRCWTFFDLRARDLSEAGDRGHRGSDGSRTRDGAVGACRRPLSGHGDSNEKPVQNADRKLGWEGLRGNSA